MTWRHGTTYDGDFVEDSAHGLGSWTSAAGDTYHGEWKDGMPTVGR